MILKHHPSSSESAPTHRRRTPTRKLVVEEEEYYTNEDDDADASDSQYNDESSQGNEYEPEQEEEDDDDDDVMGSESMSNAALNDPSFSQEPNSYYVPESNKTSSISASSYVKIAPLPIFRGNSSSESPITHLSRFNKVCRANNASSIETLKRVFPVTLEDEAALWYDLNIEPYYSSLSWDDIKLSFLQAYYNVEELKSELSGLHQGESESVRSYFLKLQWVLKRWPEHGLNDDLLKGVFVDGLREEFRDWVLTQKPNSLNDALRLAFGFEQLRSVRGKNGMVSTCGFCEGSHEERACKVKEGMREVWRQSKQKEWSDGVAVDLLRSFSIGERSGQGKVETDDEKGGQSVKKKHCQCSKHQCWKKKLEEQ